MYTVYAIRFTKDNEQREVFQANFDDIASARVVFDAITHATWEQDVVIELQDASNVLQFDSPRNHYTVDDVRGKTAYQKYIEQVK